MLGFNAAGIKSQRGGFNAGEFDRLAGTLKKEIMEWRLCFLKKLLACFGAAGLVPGRPRHQEVTGRVTRSPGIIERSDASCWRRHSVSDKWKKIEIKF